MQFSRHIGYCIYCGSKDGRLTREHVVPKGMGGKHKIDGFHHAPVLRAASCDSCREITSSIEEYCLQEMFDPIRMRLGLKQSTHPAEIVTRLRLQSGEVIERKEAAASVTASLAIPLFTSAPRLLNPETPKQIRIVHANIFPPKYKEVDGSIIASHYSKLDVKIYERMIAKIGLGLAFCKHDPARLRPLVGKFIRGEETDGHGKYVFGRPLDQELPAEKGAPFMFTVAEKLVNGRVYVFSYVRLFALFGTPTHGVVAAILNQE